MIPSLNYREVAKRLRQLGFELYRQGKGSHEIWRHPDGRWATSPQSRWQNNLAPHNAIHLERYWYRLCAVNDYLGAKKLL